MTDIFNLFHILNKKDNNNRVKQKEMDNNNALCTNLYWNYLFFKGLLLNQIELIVLESESRT